jgi:hypothetical protein
MHRNLFLASIPFPTHLRTVGHGEGAGVSGDGLKGEGELPARRMSGKGHTYVCWLGLALDVPAKKLQQGEWVQRMAEAGG